MELSFVFFLKEKFFMVKGIRRAVLGAFILEPNNLWEVRGNIYCPIPLNSDLLILH